MGLKTKKLIKLLDSMINLLADDGEQHWHDYLIKAKQRIKVSDFSGIMMLSNAFGGMGSINDLVLGYIVPEIPGPVVWKTNAKKSNEQFASLRVQVHALVFEIKRSALVD